VTFEVIDNMVVNMLLAQMPGIVEYQLPMFLLIFGILFFILAYAFRAFAPMAVIPFTIMVIAIAITWFIIQSGGLDMPTEAIEIIGFGLIFVVIGRIFGGV